MTPELQARILLLRSRMADGQAITPEEMREAIVALREGRQNAAKAAASSKAKVAKAPVPSADDLLKEMGL